MDSPLPDLDKKAGPFTLAQWSGVIGLGVAVGLGVRWYRGRNGSDTPATTPEDGATDDGAVSYVDDSPDPLTGSQVFSGSPFPTASVYPGASGAVGFSNNDQWGQAAIAELIKRGKSPTGSTNAIARYLNSEGLSVADRDLVDEAIRAIGVPPTPISSQPLDEPQAPTPRQDRPEPVPLPEPIPPTPAPITPAPAPAPPPQLVPEPLPPGVENLPPDQQQAYARPTLRKGSNGQAVKALAQWFNVVMKRGGSDWLVAESTGVFDDQMERQVRDFQAYTPVAVDGIVGPSTWAWIQEHAKNTGVAIPAY